MKVLVLDRTAVTSLLSMRTCIDLMRDALASLARGQVTLPLRPVLRVPDTNNAFALMPAYSAALGAFGAKFISVFPENHGSELDSHQGAVVLMDGRRGNLLALLDAASITAIRTAAVSAVATTLLARKDAATVAILGCGVQGRAHLTAMLAARSFRRVVLWSRNPAHAAALAQEGAHQTDAHLADAHLADAHQATIAVAADVESAVREADVVCTVTASREPVLRGDWLRAGTHVNAVGASVPAARELDTEAVQRARVFVDRRESALKEAGDLLIPMAEGAITAQHIVAEIGELLTGAHAGRRDASEITLFKSLGLAVEDLACAHYLHERAARDGAGTWIEL